MTGCVQCLNEAAPGSWLCYDCQGKPEKNPAPDESESQQSIDWSIVDNPNHFETENIMSDNVATLPQPSQPDDLVEHVWSDKTLKQVDSYASLVADINAQRQALNDKKAAGKSALVAIGFDNDALNAAISYSNTPEEGRHTWDKTYIFARKALGCPLQEDLFMAAMADKVTVETPKDKDKDSAPV